MSEKPKLVETFEELPPGVKSAFRQGGPEDSGAPQTPEEALKAYNAGVVFAMRTLGETASQEQHLRVWSHGWVPAEPNEFYKCRNGRDPTDLEDTHRLPPIAIRDFYNGYKSFRNSAQRSVVALAGVELGDPITELPDVMKALRDYLVGQMIVDDASNKGLKIIQKAKLAKYRETAQKELLELDPESLDEVHKLALACHAGRATVWSEALKKLEEKYPFLLASEKR